MTSSTPYSSPSSPRSLVVLLAFNEGACIGDTVREVRAVMGTTDVLVVDDGSSDDTAAKARAAGATVIRHPVNLGVAAAEATGLTWAHRRCCQRVVRLDGDGQHDPRSVHRVLARLDAGADLVVGSRYLEASSASSTAFRRAGGRVLSGLLSLLTGQRMTDPTSGLRGFGPRAIALFSTNFPHEYPEPESVLMAVRRGLTVAEVAAEMRPRRTGQSSLTPLGSAFYMAKVCFALVLESLRRPA